MKALLIAIALICPRFAPASFLDCRPANWFSLSVELTGDGTASRFIQTNKQEGYAGIANPAPDPVYVVVKGREIFKLSDNKVYEARKTAGPEPGWEKMTFTYKSDTGEPNPTADLAMLTVDLKNLAQFGVSEAQNKRFKAKMARCGPRRPVKIGPSESLPISFHLKSGNQLYKVEGKVTVRPNEAYNPHQACCE